VRTVLLAGTSDVVSGRLGALPPHGTAVWNGTVVDKRRRRMT